MSGRGRKKKKTEEASDPPPVQKLKIKPIPEPTPEPVASGKKHAKKRKNEVSPISSLSPSDEDSGLKMKFILSPKRVKVESSPGRSETPDELSYSTGGSSSSKGKKKDKLKAKLVFEDQVLTLDGDTVTHEEMLPSTSGKKGKGGGKSSEMKQAQATSGKKKKKESDKSKIKEEIIPPFTKIPKSQDKARMKALKAESDSGYSDTPSTVKGKKTKAKLLAQAIAEETPVPSPQASDVSRDSISVSKKKQKKDKDKTKKKKMFKFKGDRNRFLNVRDSDNEFGDTSLSRSSFQDEDSLSGAWDAKDEFSFMDSMMPQMPVPNYNLEKQEAADLAQLARSKVRLEGAEDEIQSGRAEDLISQLTAGGSDEMDTIYPSYMLGLDDSDKSEDGDGWMEMKKKKKKMLKDKKKKKKKDKLKLLERDSAGNVKHIIRKTKISGYLLWCRSYRPTFVAENPGLDFSTISRRMGALWKLLPDKEKDKWQKREMVVNTRVPMARYMKKGKGSSAALADKPPFQIASVKHTPKKEKEKKLPAAANARKKKKKPIKITPPRWQPIDCAAYLRLLGCSMSDVGRKLQTHKGEKVDVSGGMGVLLDSLLCAMGPLLCLTDQVPALQQCMTKKTKSTTLDNIAYIMPGL